ncbi:L,D-transpeptidase family protein [Massilia sp. PAMC28688]|uniref:L,D-transpeptidase family protein n=1 Tax=Massilia sp. PAMC28688 TaxID=2861283 RepID=UPI001C63A301|nr:L,D-transpeptidase family protein [Massilia sp. PAMC28688]QYF92990.1 L,D-transpeptidase family protein [Massilia sp. PAMC28688]
MIARCLSALMLAAALANAPAAAAAPDPAATAEMMQRLYPPGAPALLWHEPGTAAAALALLGQAAEHGLDPGDYAADELAARFALSQGDYGVDRALSLAILHLLSDLHEGRVAPDLRLPARDGAVARFDPAGQLLMAMQRQDPGAAVEAAAPRNPLYQRVRASLRHYRTLARDAPPWPTPAGLAPGGALTASPPAALAALRERLVLLGDLDPEAASPNELAAALARFQARHGLAENGRLDRDTLGALAVPLGHRVRQLALTLERLRWMPPLRPGRIIVVNVAAYRLWAFNTTAPAAAPLEMKVIVGKAARTQTPLFIGQMRYLEFNPYWNVPPSIARAEIAPKLARDPGYLVRQQMELVSASGQVQRSAGPGAAAALRAGTLRVRQRPGAHNVLGAVKFAMPNPMNIYLHSTSARELFGKTRRDLSHGCIRLERPAELAQFVLDGQAPWDAASIAAAMAPGPMRRVTLDDVIPVVLFYATAATDRQGRALFAEDIYRRDAALLRSLAARGPHRAISEALQAVPAAAAPPSP